MDRFWVPTTNTNGFINASATGPSQPTFLTRGSSGRSVVNRHPWFGSLRSDVHAMTFSAGGSVNVAPSMISVSGRPGSNRIGGRWKDMPSRLTVWISKTVRLFVSACNSPKTNGLSNWSMRVQYAFPCFSKSAFQWMDFGYGLRFQPHIQANPLCVASPGKPPWAQFGYSRYSIFRPRRRISATMLRECAGGTTSSAEPARI